MLENVVGLDQLELIVLERKRQHRQIDDHVEVEVFVEVDIQKSRLLELAAADVETSRRLCSDRRSGGSHRLRSHRETMHWSDPSQDRRVWSGGVPTSPLGARCPRGCLERTTPRG